nr:DUF4865 family protein [Herbaspirillum sp. ASV7]
MSSIYLPIAIMIIAHYEHRLPTDYDLERIRSRAAQRGQLWDDTRDLYFKAFLLRESGHHGATGHSYSSLYLWRNAQALTQFVGSRFRSVTDSFGRPEIQTRLALDARRGNGNVARLAYRQDVDIARDADLAAVLAEETARNQAQVSRPAIVAGAVGVDVQQWRVSRILLSESELDHDAGVAYQVLYLARPELEQLPR